MDGDGQVNVADLGALLSNFGMSGATAGDGDLNGDEAVDVSDLGLLLSRFGVNCG